MSRILFLCQHFYPELVSTGLHMTELATKMVEIEPNNQITVFCAKPAKEEFNDINSKKNELYKGLKIVRVNNFGKQHGSVLYRIVFGITFFLKACFYLLSNKNKFDVILLTTNPPFLGLAPYILKFALRKPYIFIVYDIYPNIAIELNVLKKSSFIAKFWKFINVGVYNNAKAIVIIGEDMRQVVKSTMRIKDEKKLHLIHNWSDKDVVFPIAKSSNNFIKQNQLFDKTILMYSGTIGRTHNVEPILQAALDMKNNNDLLFVFAGNGAKKKMITSFIATNKLSNIINLPFQPIEMLSEMLSSATISFVCLEKNFSGLSVPSKTYGIMAAGVPVLGLIEKKSEIGQTILRHRCGIVWEEDDNNGSFTATLEKMLDNQIALREMAINARKAFLENYDLTFAAKKYNILIQSICAFKL